ncbi:glycoside hydrolase family 81 protein [Planoprotostelium fungivorum]|uniref:glucan endo-1,3-beta-D-glucosidase n=1 Tax=Planoprotostelium fungivorum TaxID=1890364 RepID=A0A2P6NZF1_9EUKA|nr:glycoside hydrolase family 81 protein [Planoprotostelium fungivorum]
MPGGMVSVLEIRNRGYIAGPFPFQAQAAPSGVTFGLPQNRDFDGTSVHMPYKPELSVGPAELFTSTDLNTYTATAFDELSVTLQWTSNGNTFTSYLVQGSPYLTFEFAGLKPQITAQNKDAFVSVNGQTVGNTTTASKFKVVTQNGLTWLVYVLSGPVSLTTSAQSLTVSSAYKGAVRVAKLKEAADESVLDKYMSVYAKSAQVTYQVSNDVATVQYKFNTNGTGSLLVLTWPHHRDQLSGSTKYQPLQYLTIKGYMKAVEANPLVLTLPLTSIKWTPNKPIDPSCSQELQKSLEYEVNHATSSFPNDMYFWGGSFGRLARLAAIADQVGRQDLLNTILNVLRDSFEPWLNGKAGSPAAYETRWGGIVSSQAATNPGQDFGNGYYNDHHFHYGYFLYGGSVLGKYDSAWLARAKPFLQSLARDIGNPSPKDPFFTVTRHKDWYAGHSWASGVANNAGNRDEESTTEAVNGYYGLYTFGLVTNDQNLIDFARLLLATEIHSNRRYWHLKDDTNDPAYPEKGYRDLATAGNLMSDSSGQWLWWGNQRLEIAAIQILPLTPITEEVVDAVWGPAMYAYSAKEFNDPSVADDWRSVIYAAHATWDPVAAYKEAATLSAWGSGNSNTNTLHFIATRGTNGICSSAGVPTPPTDVFVTLLSKSTGQYLDGGSTPKAKVAAAQAGKYKIQWMPGGFTVVSQTTGKYVSGGNGGTVTAGSAEAKGWESFQFKQVGQYWAIVANSNKMYAEVQADGTLKTTAGSATDATLFTISSDGSVPTTTAAPTSKSTTAIPTSSKQSTTTKLSTTTAAPAPTSGNLTGSNYFYISSKSAGLYLTSSATDQYVRVNGTRQQATRYLVAAIQGKDNLFSVQDVKTSQYVCADSNGDQPLIANRGSPSGWESFSFEKQGQYWAIRADDNKKYVAVQSDKRTQATSDKVQDSALWTLTSA